MWLLGPPRQGEAPGGGSAPGTPTAPAVPGPLAPQLAQRLLALSVSVSLPLGAPALSVSSLSVFSNFNFSGFFFLLISLSDFRFRESPFLLHLFFLYFSFLFSSVSSSASLSRSKQPSFIFSLCLRHTLCLIVSLFLDGSFSVPLAMVLLGWLIGMQLDLAQSLRAGNRELGMWAVCLNISHPTRV